MNSLTKHRPPPARSFDGIERLCFAIVRQACYDFNKAYFDRKALEYKAFTRKLSESESDDLTKARAMEVDCLTFFHSQWYGLLCDVDPDALIRELKIRRMKSKE